MIRCWVSLALALGVFAAEPVDLIVSGRQVVTMDAKRRVIPGGAVAVKGERIVAVGTRAEIDRAYKAKQRIDRPDALITPGLINTHTHAPMSLFRGIADDLRLQEWLEKYIFPAEAQTVSPEFVRAGAALASLEMIRSGTTTFADMYYFEEEIAAVVKQAGLRGVLGQTIIQFPVPDAPTPQAALARTEAFITRFKGDPLITPAVAPHSMYTLDADVLKASRAMATRHGVPLLIHLAETSDEVTTARERHRTTPTRWLDSLGFWGPQTLAAHGVWVPQADITLLAARGVGLSHNPESNMKLASGTAPVPAYLAAGVPLGLGTDGAASNNDLDMFDELRTAALLAKAVSRDATVFNADQALYAATLGGARAMGLESEIGSLEVGKQADLITVELSALEALPLYDAVSQLVYAGARHWVRDVWIAGSAKLRDRRLVDIDTDRLAANARRWQQTIRQVPRA